jgi:hypothetical protein
VLPTSLANFERGAIAQITVRQAHPVPPSPRPPRRRRRPDGQCRLDGGAAAAPRAAAPRQLPPGRASASRPLPARRRCRAPQKPYAPIEVAVGDNVKFTWAAGEHDVWSLPSAECDFGKTNAGAAELAAADAGAYTWTAAAPGVVRVACSISDHCSEGQLLEITVKAAAGAGAGAEAPAGGIPTGTTAADMANGAAPMPEGMTAADMARADAPKADALQAGTAPDAIKPVNGTAVGAVGAQVEAAAVASGTARVAGAACAVLAAASLLA